MFQAALSFERVGRRSDYPINADALHRGTISENPAFRPIVKIEMEPAMTERMRLNRKAAKFEPESQFESPQKLAEEPGLTLGERIATLKRWAELVDRRLSSVAEGMPSRGNQDLDAELLREIEICREELMQRVKDDGT